MKLELITLATVKTQLGLSVSTYDSALTALIPIVSSDVRRILQTNFDKYVSCDVSTGSDKMSLSYSYGIYPDHVKPMLDMGQIVYNPGLPDETYIKSFDPTTGQYTLSANATDDVTYIYPSITLAQQPTIAKMIWYRYSKQNTTSASEKDTASESYGPVSVAYSESEINKKWNYPQALINDLGQPFARIG